MSIIVFWCLFALFLTVAVLAVSVPLMRTPKPYKDHSPKLLDALYQQKRQQLKIELQNIEQQQLFEKNLQNNFVKEPTIYEHRCQRASWWVIGSLIIALPAVVMIGYQHWGSIRAWQQYDYQQKNPINVKQAVAEMGGVTGVLHSLEQRLQQDPDHPQGWYLLGRMYLSQHNAHAAVTALMKANQMQEGQPEVMTALAGAIFVDNHQRLTKPAKKLLEDSLKIAPDNIEAINLLAVNAYVTKHYQTAIQYWEQMIPYFDPDSKDGKQLFSMIHQAQKKL